MGITTKTITAYACDICGSPCNKNDGEINIKINNGDGRDVGPATIHAVLVFNQPYGCANGIVCRACKIEWLGAYLHEMSGGWLWLK